MADPISLIPEGKEYDVLRWMLSRLRSDFGDKYDQLANQDSRIQGWVDEINSGGGRDADQIRDDIVKYIIGFEDAAAKYDIDQETFDRLVLGGNEGGINFGDLSAITADATAEEATTDDDPATLPGVLAGGETIKVSTETGDRFYQVYEFPAGSGQFISYQFNDLESLKAIMGETPPLTTRSEDWFNQNVIAEAPAEEVVGLAGSFQGYTAEVMRDAAVAAGITDPTLVGQMASDPEMQAIMAQAITGDWTDAQVLAAQRNTGFWQDVLYPGIDQFYGKTTEPELAWANYTRSVETSLSDLGYARDADGTYNSTVARMLELNIDAGEWLTQVPTYIAATENSEFAEVLNAWAERDLGRSVDFNDWFDLMAGESTPELNQVAENARIAYLSEQATTGLADAQIEALAGRTDLTDTEARQAFSEFNQAVLALGDQGLQRGGLTRDEILAAAAGIDPSTGRSIDEVKLQVAKLARENDLFDEQKISFFTQFDPVRGTPFRPGLTSLAPEGA